MHLERTQKIASTGAFLLMTLGISLQIKAGIGQSTFNALCVTLSQILNMNVGTIINILNGLFFILFMYLTTPRFTRENAFIIVVTLLNGMTINLISNHLLGTVTVTHYITKIIVFLIGLCFSSISLGYMISIGFIRFPLESVCLELAKRTRYSLQTIRYTFDGLFLLLGIMLTSICKSPLNIREGTLLSFFLFARLLGISYSHFALHKESKSCDKLNISS